MAAPDRPIAVTPGEPAGIGPDLVLALAGGELPAAPLAFADPELLRERAAALGLDIAIEADPDPWPAEHVPGRLRVATVPVRAGVAAGRLDPANAGYVVDTLERAAGACSDGRAAALVTAPVHKGVINDAGIRFSGHTERLGELTGGRPVMMLVGGGLRVALVTTHLALADVPPAITGARLTTVLETVHADLTRLFGIEAPRIAVAGLNPHAGEGGHLGREEIDIIQPVLERLRRGGLDLAGPLPADTLFTPANLEGIDAVLAMYHDQGLPVLKYASFGEAVNVTLGLPIVRTSVDHGTALELAGTGRARAGSLRAAFELACELTTKTPRR